MKTDSKKILGTLLATLLPLATLVVNFPFQLMAKIKGESTVGPQTGTNCGGVDRSSK